MPAVKPLNAVAVAALAQDPSLFDYDAAADAARSARSSALAARAAAADASAAAGPRYLTAILESSARRKQERDLVRERSALRDRAREDAADAAAGAEKKQRFVTGAYKQRLEEMRLWDQDKNGAPDSGARSGAGPSTASGAGTGVGAGPTRRPQAESTACAADARALSAARERADAGAGMGADVGGVAPAPKRARPADGDSRAQGDELRGLVTLPAADEAVWERQKADAAAALPVADRAAAARARYLARKQQQQQ